MEKWSDTLRDTSPERVDGTTAWVDIAVKVPSQIAIAAYRTETVLTFMSERSQAATSVHEGYYCSELPCLHRQQQNAVYEITKRYLCIMCRT